MNMLMLLPKVTDDDLIYMSMWLKIEPLDRRMLALMKAEDVKKAGEHWCHMLTQSKQHTERTGSFLVVKKLFG